MKYNLQKKKSTEYTDLKTMLSELLNTLKKELI